jgi:TP901 family phage tail tape measure protein
MALREVLASFGIDFDKEGNLEKGDKQVDDLTDKLLGLGKTIAAAFAVDAIVSFGHELLQEADALAKQSQALGISAQELQGWQHAAALSGSSAEEFSAAFTKFTRNVNEASEAATGPAAKAFKELGVQLKDSAGNIGSPIDLLDGVVAGLEGIQDPAKRTALVMDLFGKSGAKLLPLFSEGEEGLKKLRAEVQELGFGFDEAFMENAQEVNDNLDRLKLGLKGVGIQVLTEILPSITEFSKSAVALVKRFVGWVKSTELVRAGLTALVGKGIMMAASAIPALIAKVGGLTKALAALGRFALRTVLPFLILEDAIGFLTGADSAIGAGLDKLFGDGTAEAARSEILKWFNDVKNVVVNDFLPALKGIVTSPLFTGGVKTALDGVLFVLSAIGLALTDNAERAEALAAGLRKSAEALGLGPSEEERAADIEAGLPENQKPLSDGQSFTRKVVTSIFGDPLDDPEVKANEERNRAILNKRKADSSAATDAIARKSTFFAPTPAPQPTSYYDAARAGAVAAAPAPTQINHQTTVGAPVTHVTVNVPPGEGELGTRVGRVAGKASGDASYRGVKAALVPTAG